MTPQTTQRDFTAIWIVAATVFFLWIELAVCRAIIVAGSPAGWQFLGYMRDFASSFSDLLYALGLGAFFALLFLLLPTQKVFRWFALALFWLAVTISMVWSISNIEVIRLLGEPVTLQWISYAGFLQNEHILTGVTETIDYIATSLALVAAVATIVLGVLAGRYAKYLPLPLGPLLFATIFAAIFGSVWQVSQRSDVSSEKLLNPVSYFLASLVSNTYPSIFTMAVAKDANAAAPVSAGIPAELRDGFDSPSPIKNVLIYVMESVPAEFVETYGGRYPVTPNLKRFEKHSLRFENFYSHIPATNRSLFSLLSGRYEDVSYESTIRYSPRLPLTTISDVFKKAGWRTGSFWSADTRFDSFDAFLAGRGFDVIEDPQSRSCNQPIYKNSTETYRYMDFTSDFCTAQSTIDWINKDASKPFFALMMSAMTHYPYFTEGATELFAEDDRFNRYLNALKTGDAALGKILDSLQATGRLESTLVVITADHGEAFGRHQNRIHAGEIYEENVHIPLILINPRLFNGGSASVVGGMSDLAPTIAEIAGMAPADDWLGYSLFAPKRPSRTFFYSPFRGYRFGYREANHKVIFNARSGTFEVYDIATDPEEQVNIAGQWPEPSEQMLAHLAAWVQNQKALFAELKGKLNERDGQCDLNEISVVASGNLFKGPPEFTASIDGTEVGRAIVRTGLDNGKLIEDPAFTAAGNAPGASVFSFPLHLQKVPDSIAIEFTNDLWESKQNDRNLYIHAVKLNGINLPLKQFTFSSDKDGRFEKGGEIGMFRSSKVVSKGPFSIACPL